MIVFIFLLFFFLNSHTKILAANITPTETPQSVNSNIEDVRKKVQEAVQKKLNETAAPASKKKGIIGTIIQIDDKQIVINSKNITTTLSISTDTVFIDSKQNKTKIAKVKVGQEILVIGILNENKILEAKRIVFIDLKSLENKYQTIVGKIVDISKSSPVFVLVPVNNKDTQYQIETDSKTEIIDKNNKKLNLNNLTSGQTIIAVIKPDEKIAKTFYVTKIINLDNKSVSSSVATSSSKLSQ
jgi:hypothetical protein